MVETITRFNAQLDVPLMIDSTEAPVLEAALKLIADSPSSTPSTWKTAKSGWVSFCPCVKNLARPLSR